MRMKYGLWSFSKFVPTDVVRQVLNAGNNEAQLGVKMREVTLLFSDIAGFTSIAERMEPNELLLLLSDYFTMMAEVIHELGGTLLEFIGDAILAIWNAPQVSHIAERARPTCGTNEQTRWNAHVFAFLWSEGVAGGSGSAETRHRTSPWRAATPSRRSHDTRSLLLLAVAAARPAVCSRARRTRTTRSRLRSECRRSSTRR